MSEKQFYLLQVNDALFPIGGYSHSQGLETYIQRGIVHDADTAREYITHKIKWNLAYTELLAARLAYEAAEKKDLQELLYLEELLIHMIRRYTIAHYSASAGIYDSCQTSSETCRNIIHYLGEHVRQSLTIEDISKDNMIGRSQLQKLFREEYQCGVIEFFSRMKIDFAKQLIRENDMNFTQISDFLGYSSIHYFSRQFKKLSGMTPTEYATSIKALSERPQSQS